MSEHYAEMTAEETAVIIALLQDKINEVEHRPEYAKGVEVMRSALDKLLGGEGVH